MPSWMDIAFTDETLLKAGRFKYYYLAWNKKQRKYFPQSGKKKATSYPGLKKDQQKGKKVKQTYKLTVNMKF